MPPSHTANIAFVAIMAAALINGCSSTRGDGGGFDIASRVLGTADATAVARVGGVPGSPVEGKVTFAQFGAAVVVRADFIGLAPHREYGLHVHEKGDCRGGDGSAGGHFNPGGAAHGRPGRGAHHAGDLPNLRTDGEGNVIYVYETGALSLTEGARNVIGRGVIVSGGPDDYLTQPDGASGPPLACGIIRRN